MRNPNEIGTPRLKFKTYSHLQAQRKIPSDYEKVTSELHYYLKKGFEVKMPLGEWYQKYQTGSPLQAKDWERFKDPSEFTYSRYTEVQKDKEIFVDRILGFIEESGYDRSLA